MISYFFLVMIVVLFVLATAFSFFWFKKTNPGLHLWWLRTPTSHALLYGTIAFILLFFVVPQSSFSQWFSQFAGILLLITGFGFIFGSFLISSWMRKMRAQRKELAMLVFVVHLGSGIAGMYLLRESFSKTDGSLTPFVVALGYIIAVGIGFIRR